MNKEVNYVLQGFLLTLVFAGAFKFFRFLYSMPSHEENEAATEVMATTDSDKAGLKKSMGQTLFRDNCASCHTIFKDMTGPALAGVEERVKDKKLLYAWIRNSQAVLKTGNPYFNGLVKKFDNVIMTPFPGLSDDDINAILEYILIRSNQKFTNTVASK